MIRHMVGAKFRRAGTSIAALRELDDFIIKNQKLPKGTSVRPILISGAPAAVGSNETQAATDGNGTQTATDVSETQTASDGNEAPTATGGGDVPAAAGNGGALSAESGSGEYMLAEWVCGPGVNSERAVLYLHGGAMVMGSPATHRELAARLSRAVDARLFVVDYRLAPEHPFPAARNDAVAAYRWLLEQGCAPERLVVAGDSAGGGLTLQTLITLRDEGMPLPAVALLMSPVTDWVHFDGESYTTRAAVDPLVVPDVCRFTARQYVGDAAPPPLLCPGRMDLSGLPPLCVHVGDYEVLLSDSVRLAERARVCGVEVELKVWPGMWHVFQAAARFVPEARCSLEEIGRFVARHLD